ncbi:hypothetical protein QYE76_031658 [Lolium multiflorum]|uniref:Retrotransposon gag domain-containing protein n=1 Tax=Lolium multiflorum TaxID=4521 RepID=A0AAD8VKD8_LOLMU|nr:hypothetical protein QYE76_031658 [Lolium multiflorum]
MGDVPPPHPMLHPDFQQYMRSMEEDRRRYQESQNKNMQDFFAQVINDKGNEGKGVTLSDFQNARPLPFASAPEPMDAEDWLMDTEGKLRTVGCNDEEKIRYATSLLSGPAASWWENVVAVHPPEKVLTWEEFKKKFWDAHVPESVVELKKREFDELQQNTAPIMQYVRDFKRLSRYAPEEVNSEEKRKKRFMKGMNPYMNMQLRLARTAEFQELIDSAITFEDDYRQVQEDRSYYRRFIEGFSKIAGPMTKLLKKNTPFVWTDECEASFQKLKEKLTTTPVLADPEPGKDYTVYCDDSKNGLGCVLMQDLKILEVHWKKLRNRAIKYCKIQWQHHPEREATWEKEDELRKSYPELFRYMGHQDPGEDDTPWSREGEEQVAEKMPKKLDPKTIEALEGRREAGRPGPVDQPRDRPSGPRPGQPVANRISLGLDRASTEANRTEIATFPIMAPSINFNQFLEKEKLKSNGSNFTGSVIESSVDAQQDHQKQGKPNKGNFKKGGKKVVAPPEKPKAGPKPDTCAITARRRALEAAWVFDTVRCSHLVIEQNCGINEALARDEVTMRVGNGSKVDVIAIGTLLYIYLRD